MEIIKKKRAYGNKGGKGVDKETQDESGFGHFCPLFI